MNFPIIPQNKKMCLSPNIMYERSFPIFQSYENIFYSPRAVSSSIKKNKDRTLQEEAHSLQDSIPVHD